MSREFELSQLYSFQTLLDEGAEVESMLDLSDMVQAGFGAGMRRHE